MRIRLAQLFALCAAGAIGQTPEPAKLPENKQKAPDKAIEALRLRAVRPKQACSVPLVNVLPQAPTAPMPQITPPRDRYHIRQAPLPAPPCDEPARK